MFVMSADSPVTSTELDFLHSISSYVEKFFFVINKIDMVEASEVEQILDFTGTLLSKELHCQDILLFPVSAQAGLEAKCQLDETSICSEWFESVGGRISFVSC
jgi:GTP-binding protein EngB required for normal cell division